ncbi:g5209 [Coccomyxa viridis]|uniref:G5209 protein n=1 Tax=Coccomyxa viridis TaxID=1274662 RepID=A0ABP1FX76_9CHLO
MRAGARKLQQVRAFSQDSSEASCSGRQHSTEAASLSLGRRQALIGLAASTSLLSIPRADAIIITPPPGFRIHQDKLDGYYFFFPENWLPVTTSGNDIFYRNPANVNENLFVDVSSPSSSAFDSVEDLGPPEQAAKRTLGQYLEELMSTRIGVKRSGEVMSATERMGPDGKKYYDIQVRVRSFASRNQLAAYPSERNKGQELEWERRYVTVLGAANKRLYQFRLQSLDKTFEQTPEALLTIAQSFRCREVET